MEVLRRSTIISLYSISSTMIAMFLGGILQRRAFFLIFVDSFANSIAITCIFNFARPLYDFFCKPCNLYCLPIHNLVLGRPDADEAKKEASLELSGRMNRAPTATLDSRND